MKILAIDTTGQSACAALTENNKLLAEYTINYKMTHSQTIMPMIDEICRNIELDLSTLDYIACSSGPGSFTGLRIGAATAKGIAHGLNIPIVPVPTLDALAYNIFDTDKIICPIMDARRSQVYSAFYEWKNGKLVRISKYMAESINDVILIAEGFDKDVIFLGDGVSVHKEVLEINNKFILAPSSCNMQRAASVAALGSELAKEGSYIDGSLFAPFYLRKSQAERELEERNNALAQSAGGSKND